MVSGIVLSVSVIEKSPLESVDPEPICVAISASLYIDTVASDTYPSETDPLMLLDPELPPLPPLPPQPATARNRTRTRKTTMGCNMFFLIKILLLLGSRFASFLEKCVFVEANAPYPRDQ
jgi:hypothetical protein